MATQITYEKTADFVRTIKRRHFSRQTRKLFLAYLPVGVIGLFGVISCWHHDKSGGVFWLLVAISISPLALWTVYYLATGYIKLAGPAPRCTARIEPERITIISDKSSSTLLWPQITAMWRFPEVVFIFWDRKTDLDHAIVLPTSSLGIDLSRFIEDKVREHGGVVFNHTVIEATQNHKSPLPFSLRAVAAYLIVYSVISVVLVLLHSSQRYSATDSIPWAQKLGAQARVITLVVLSFVSGVGLFYRRAWARKLGL